MNTLVQKFKLLNEVYKSMQKNFETLKKMFKNHSTIKQQIVLTEQMMNQVYMTIRDKFEEVEVKREFTKIVKNIKNEK